MEDLAQAWAAVWGWCVANTTIERLALIASALAILVSMRAARHSKRSANAAEIQAGAALNQARITEKQLEATQEQLAELWISERAAHVSELAVLSEYQSRIEADSPRISVGLEETPGLPVYRIFRHSERLSNPYLRYPTEDQPSILDELDNEYDDLYWIVRGVVLNEGTVSVHISADEPEIISGESPIMPEVLNMPIRLGGREFLLRPGEAALFEWRAEMMLEHWIALYKLDHQAEFSDIKEEDLERWRRIRRPVGRFVAWTAGSTDNPTLISIIVDNDPIRPVWSRSNGVREAKKWRITDRGKLYVYPKTKRINDPRDINALEKRIKDLNIWGQSKNPWNDEE
ncbi:hypothetical protein [Streptosporangium sp. NPDC048865]|uniref:hypothetical protein n=1 Tax=Streptosporangium sp. NPDC048865 TaxID=3155766 RepID=UPI0034185050